MFCPKCNVDMRQARKEGVIIDVCPQCRGIWLDHGELEKIMHEAQNVMVEYDELYNYYDGHKQKHKEYHYDNKHTPKHYKKKHGLFNILGDIFD